MRQKLSKCIYYIFANVLNHIIGFPIALLSVIFCFISMYTCYTTQGIWVYLTYTTEMLVFLFCPYAILIFVPSSKYSKEMAEYIKFLIRLFVSMVIGVIIGEYIFERTIYGSIIIDLVNDITGPTISSTISYYIAMMSGFCQPVVEIVDPIILWIENPYKSFPFLKIYRSRTDKSLSAIYEIYRPVSDIYKIYSPIILHHLNIQSNIASLIGTLDAIKSEGNEYIYTYIHVGIEDIISFFRDTRIDVREKRILSSFIYDHITGTLNFNIANFNYNLNRLVSKVGSKALNLRDLSCRGYYVPMEYDVGTLMKVLYIKLNCYPDSLYRPFYDACTLRSYAPIYLSELINIGVFEYVSSTHDVKSFLLQNGFTIEEIHNCEYTYPTIRELNPNDYLCNWTKCYSNVFTGHNINPMRASQMYINKVLPRIYAGLMTDEHIYYFSNKYLNSMLYYHPYFIDGVPTHLVTLCSYGVVGGLIGELINLIIDAILNP